MALLVSMGFMFLLIMVALYIVLIFPLFRIMGRVWQTWPWLFAISYVILEKVIAIIEGKKISDKQRRIRKDIREH